MQNSLPDRDLSKFREALNGKSKVAIVSEDDAGSLKFDQASSTILYLAVGLYGALTSEAKWKIQKIDTSSGVAITNASQDFDQIWDNRAVLTYV